jgi:hypothetical protein
MVIDRAELLAGLFSMRINVTSDETDLLMSMFDTKDGFTFDKFSQLIISGDSTRRKRSQLIPVLQREETITRMNHVSQKKRQERIKERTPVVSNRSECTSTYLCFPLDICP